MPEPHVVFLPSWYPTETHPLDGVFFREQARALRDAGVRMGVLYPELRSLRTFRPGALARNRFQATWGEEDGIPVYRAHGWNLLPRVVAGGRLWARVAAGLLRRYVARHGRPDLIHAHAVLWGGFAAWRLKEATGIPYVITENFSGFTEDYTGFTTNKVTPAQREAARRAYHGAEWVMALGSPLQHVLAEWKLADPARLGVMPHMVDTAFFSLPPTPRAKEGPFRFLSVALLEPRKGQELLMRALARAFPGGGAELEFAGGGTDRPRLEAIAAELGIADRVRFLGPLDRNGVREAMWRAHALAHGAYAETFGVVLIEALSAGLPVVSTACSGPEDILTPEVGELTPVGDVEAMAAAMARMRERWPGMEQETVRRRAQEHFSRDVVVRRLKDVYRAALGRGAPTPAASRAPAAR